MRWLFPALSVLLVAVAHAQNPDPLRSPECGAARDSLEQALQDASARVPGAAARLTQARKEAIAMCLGGEAGGRERSGAPDPVAVVPPVGPRVAMPPSPATVAITPLPPPPAAIVSCDPGGCWDSTGRRLGAQGPVLAGPRGACMVQGAVVICP